MKGALPDPHRIGMPEKSPEEALAEPMPNPVLLLAEFHQEPFCLGFGKFFVEPLTLRYILSEDFVETGNLESYSLQFRK